MQIAHLQCIPLDITFWNLLNDYFYSAQKETETHSDWAMWLWRASSDNMHWQVIFVAQISKYVPEFMQDVSYSCGKGQHEDHMSFKSHLNTILKALVGFMHSMTLFMGINFLSVIFILFSKEDCTLRWGSGTILWVKMKVVFWFSLFSHFPPPPPTFLFS